METFSLFAGVGIFVIAAVFSLGLSGDWLGPLFRFGHTAMVPIWESELLDDNYYYFGRVRKIIQGSLLMGDPIVREFARRPHPHCTNQASLFFCGLLLYCTKSATFSYFFTRLMFPFLHYIVLVWTLFWLTGETGFSVVSGIVILNCASHWYIRKRIPNILVTGFHLTCTILLLYWYWSGNLGAISSVLLVCMVALSPLVSVQNGIFVGTLCLALLMAGPELACEQKYLLLAVVGASIPTMYIFVRSMQAWKPLLRFCDTHNYQINRRWLVNALLYVALPCLGSLALLHFFPESRFGTVLTFCLLFSLAALAVAGASLLFWGKWESNHFIERGFVFSSATVSLALLCIAILETTHMNALMSSEVKNSLDLFFILATLIYVIHWGYKRAQSPWVYFSLEHKQLIHWAEGLSDRDVIVTLDFDTATSLPAYTRAWFYIPQLVMSCATEEETWDRMYEVCAFFGVSTIAFFKFLARCIPSVVNREGDLRPFKFATRYLTYVQHVDFYREKTKYHQEQDAAAVSSTEWITARFAREVQRTPGGHPLGWGLPEQVREEKLKGYVEYVKKHPSTFRLRYGATHVLLSASDPIRGALTPESMRQAGVDPVFQNSRFCVYRMDDVQKVLYPGGQTEGAHA